MHLKSFILYVSPVGQINTSLKFWNVSEGICYASRVCWHVWTLTQPLYGICLQRIPTCMNTYPAPEWHMPTVHADMYEHLPSHCMAYASRVYRHVWTLTQPLNGICLQGMLTCIMQESTTPQESKYNQHEWSIIRVHLCNTAVFFLCPQFPARRGARFLSLCLCSL